MLRYIYQNMYKSTNQNRKCAYYKKNNFHEYKPYPERNTKKTINAFKHLEKEVQKNNRFL